MEPVHKTEGNPDVIAAGGEYGTKAQFADALRKVLASEHLPHTAAEVRAYLPKGTIKKVLDDAVLDPGGTPPPEEIRILVAKIEVLTHRLFPTWLVPKVANTPGVNAYNTMARVEWLCSVTGWTINLLAGGVSDRTLRSSKQLWVFMDHAKHPIRSQQGVDRALISHLPELTNCRVEWIIKGEGAPFAPGIFPKGPGGVLMPMPTEPPPRICLAWPTQAQASNQPPSPRACVPPGDDAQGALPFGQTRPVVDDGQQVRPSDRPAVQPPAPHTPEDAVVVPMAGAAVGIQRYMTTFNGMPLVTIQYKGKICWPAAMLSVLLGHDPKYLSQKLAGDWASEFTRGQHIDLLTGEELREFRAILEQVASEATCRVPGLDPNVGRLLIVNETGFYKILTKSETEAGVAFREHIASDVMPQIVRTGAFITQAKKAEALAQGELIREILAQNCLVMRQMVDQVSAQTSELLRQSEERTEVQTRLLTDRLDRLEKKLDPQDEQPLEEPQPPLPPAPSPPPAPTPVTVQAAPGDRPMRRPEHWADSSAVWPRLEEVLATARLKASDVGPRMTPQRPRPYVVNLLSKMRCGANLCVKVLTLQPIVDTIGCRLQYVAWGEGKAWDDDEPSEAEPTTT